MKNNALIGIAFNQHFRFYIADTKEMVNELNEINNSTPVAIAALGRSSSITGLMGLMLKGNDVVTTTVAGNGPLGNIITTANANGEIKATVFNPQVEGEKYPNGKLNVGKAVGQGNLRVVKDLGMKEPFVGEIELVSGEISEDYTRYYAVSEQVSTAITSGVLIDKDHTIKAAGALIVQVLPEATEEEIIEVERRFLNLEALTTLLQKYRLEEIIELLFEKDYKILESRQIKFKCDCSYERFERGLMLLAESEKQEIKEEKEVECVCNFCHRKYNIATENL